MMMSPSLPSPMHRFDRLSREWNVDLWVKRDDLIPQFLGGNKVRKNFQILKAACESEGVPDVLITNGGAQSNHARVVALMGAQLGCQVHLVLHGDRPSEASGAGNAFFYHCADSATHYVEPRDIAPTIQRIEAQAKREGLTVCVIPGGGHSKVGAGAYSDAVSELPFAPDYIVHASGTGGTQAGLLQGVEQKGWASRVVGVSIARTKERGIEEIANLLPTTFRKEDILFRDAYRFGGYEKSDHVLVAFVKEIVKKEGVPLDLTYTGKAMYGLRELVASGDIEAGSRIVFWHTGGLLNMMSGN